MRKVLMLASVASMISQFNMDNIRLLKELGYEVHVACNFEEGSTCDERSIERLKSELYKEKVHFFQIDFSRSIFHVGRNIKAYHQVKKLLHTHKYLLLHCHSPIGGVVGRMAGHRTKTKVLYTAHGFHFFQGAPIKNWLLYYPIEWICSWWTDCLIAINKEDYHLAQKHMHAKRVAYVPGVGIDLIRFSDNAKGREETRKQLGLKPQTIMVLSVGELNENKNHETAIEALCKLNEIDFRYFICGQGKLDAYLKKQINKCHMNGKIMLLGYRTDISELYQAADLFVFPSQREGLSVALMEAMAAGLPVVCGKIRGNEDLITDKKGGFLVEPVKNVLKFSGAIKTLMENEEMRSRMGRFNKTQISGFGLEKVNSLMKTIYTAEEVDL